ncbi:AraC family transcriptional regulator [Corynebacterium sp. CNJ-954]|uniref:helix-turn-helix domain-containing protein n=1 Tax=Corynebacterium sp. CNJ-954 TaxID=1904962 RepID=UPI000AF087B0|nr:AraC family transcriptional regulator [Corynebacterium sp. CNJ-954]
MTVESRSLPFYRAGELSFDVRAFGWDEVFVRDTVWGEHSHPTHELLWHDYGSGAVSVGQRVWTIAGGVALWIPAGLVHTGRAHAGSRQRTVHFTVDTPALGEDPVTVELTPLLGLLIDRLGTTGLGGRSRELTERMILDVITPSERELVLSMPTSELLGPIVERMRDCPADQTTLSVWATRLGVSTKTITRTFEAETGLGFSRWIAMARMKHAVVLLGAGDEIAEVAEQVGYRSASAFITAFRRATGLTPGQFRSPEQ